MEWNEFILGGIMVLWALSLIINRKIIERRIMRVENRVENLEGASRRSGSNNSRSVGPRR